MNSSGLAEIFRPIVGFCLFGAGKLIFTLSLIIMQEAYLPGFTTKPYTMYLHLSVFFFSQLGLHFFMAYQEFIFYSFSSFYRTIVDRVLEMTKEEPKPTMISPSEVNSRVEENSTVVRQVLRRDLILSDASKGILYGNLKELVEVMKNMAEAFGPFLLQNFTAMLFFWLLHVYCLIYAVVSVAKKGLSYKGASQFGLTIICPNLAGLALIVR